MVNPRIQASQDPHERSVSPSPERAVSPSPERFVQYIVAYGYVEDGDNPVEFLYDLLDRGSFTHVFTCWGLDLQDPIAVRVGDERRWRFTHVECLVDIPFRFSHGVVIIWSKWGLRDLVNLDFVSNENDIENPVWPDPEEIWAARQSGYHSI
ncbi:hypothetical protein FOMPIDRAFT_1051287 [Fomitopsis schrenkii]|nr:hypothetical protein FOMPIDRAFT_1051287 [Fomitopsis schrenkii]